MTQAAVLDDDSWISKSNWHRIDGMTGSDQDKLSLRYLDEFVGDLTCSAQMLAWGLFPDAKEVTETMGVFNAIRKLGLHEKDTATPDGMLDGIVVVGDGVTPRTAAMFAYRTKGWTCYSVDPIMKVSTDHDKVPWDGVLANVVSVCDKIENIRIRLRKAIVVLVHAHVTIEQAMCAIDATEIIAVLTLPCCNWYGRQEQCFGRQPDLVYDDLSILSVHREVRLWMTRPGKLHAAKLVSLGGCVEKAYKPPVVKDSTVASDFLALVLQQSAPSAPSTVEHMAAFCAQHFQRDWRVGVIGRQDELVHALSRLGFTAIDSIEAEDDISTLTWHVLLDCGNLHRALNRTDKTKSGNLVGHLCQRWQTWLVDAPGAAVVILSSRRMLRSRKFLNRTTLHWASVTSISLSDPPNFIYVCQTKRNEVQATQDSSIHHTIDRVAAVLAVQFDEAPAMPVHASGAVSRIQALHGNLSFVDLQSADGTTTHVLLQERSLPQDPTCLMPRSLVQVLQLGASNNHACVTRPRDLTFTISR
ncbi:hypothetical protein, variant 1 [Aphanomyces invadans]|uniref:Uncharacterized protein n=1 Tax=Aphanomyces invadans TaxID=157072 RepID=A0A024UHI0_9STRA|nr:hypothetical protein, variant 1 [Aphanomyces invadans]ETW05749.1 hypothetical protein, variant 1 [Aphanomyces invadans]|eukprot:XP_008865527.1 hypothetical protein, variant 1 [Aphanomyces invadans]